MDALTDDAGDIVDLDLDTNIIEVESGCQAPLSIQQPQVMEHEHMKMRKGGDLFFGGRSAEDDEVEDWGAAIQGIPMINQHLAPGTNRHAYSTDRINLNYSQNVSLGSSGPTAKGPGFVGTSTIANVHSLANIKGFSSQLVGGNQLSTTLYPDSRHALGTTSRLAGPRVESVERHGAS